MCYNITYKQKGYKMNTYRNKTQLNEYKSDLNKITQALNVIERYKTEIGTENKIVKKTLKNLEENIQKKYQLLYNENYMETIKNNFHNNNFKVKEDKIKMILSDEYLLDLVKNKYIEEGKKTQESFNIKINLKPTIKDLRKFLINIK